jgi:hypothetical protein
MLKRDAFAVELERVRVAQLVRREAMPDAGLRCEPADSERTAALDQGRPRLGRR